MTECYVNEYFLLFNFYRIINSKNYTQILWHDIKLQFLNFAMKMTLMPSNTQKCATSYFSEASDQFNFIGNKPDYFWNTRPLYQLSRIISIVWRGIHLHFLHFYFWMKTSGTPLSYVCHDPWYTLIMYHITVQSLFHILIIRSEPPLKRCFPAAYHIWLAPHANILSASHWLKPYAFALNIGEKWMLTNYYHNMDEL